MISRLTRRVVLAIFACALFASLGAVAIASAAGPGRVRLGPAPPHPPGSSVVGALPASTAIDVTVTLKPRDPVALAQYATAVSTPGSSLYRHYLTVAEFRQRFGPTASQIAAVLGSLRAHGLRPGAVTPNGLAIPVQASAGAFGKAFSTSFERVALHSGRKAFANVSAPALDSSIAGLVQGVIGLDNLAIPRPLALHAVRGRARVSPRVVTGGPQPCSAATSAAPGQSAYTTDQIASAYGFSGLYGAGDEGAGQTVAIFELEGNFPTDITAFESCYGISASVSYQKVDGGPPKPRASNEDGLETELDIDNVIGLAPKANVIVYQGPNTNAGLVATYNAIVTNTSVNVVSTSWGLCEAQNIPSPTVAQDENTLFQEAATQGQSVFAAAGDSGSEDCGGNSLAVDDPASQPYVTGAGGTSLTSLGPPPTESVWNDQCSDGPCGGGGGISSLWQMPSYQSGAPSALNVINPNSSRSPCGASAGSYCREVPDVSANADPSTGYLVYWDGSWTGIGGTSGAAPLWAGLMADVNESPACNGASVGFANPALYDAAAADYSSDFNDITSGDNALSGSGQTLYPAGPGYDMASGLGTPNAYHLAAATCGDLVQITNPGSQTDHVSATNPNVQLQIAATDTKGNALTYSETGLPSGVSINASTGEISGQPTTGSTSDVTVTAADADGAAGQVTFTLTIVIPVTVSNPGTQTSVVGTAVSLQISGSDSGGKALSYSDNNTLPRGLSISSSGLISGTPTTPGPNTVTITATDGTYSNSTQFTWTINPVVVTVTPPGNQVGIVGMAASLQMHASDNDGGTIIYSATDLPSGISINSSNGLISGTPTTPGPHTVIITATDGTYSNSTQFTWTINPVVVTVTPPGNQVGIVGMAASLQMHASDNDGGTIIYGATDLPSGISINSSNGLISGTPTTPGPHTVTITATDGTYSNSTQFTWTISSATVAIANPGNQTVHLGTPARLQINATDNNGGALSYSTSGLPAGLSIDSATGLITGTPSRAGRWGVTVVALDGPSSASTAFTWVIPGPPKASKSSLTGTAQRRPKLTFTLNAGTDAPAIKRIVLTLPKALGFARKALKHEITVNGSHRLSFTLRGRKLTITLKRAGGIARVTIGTPALTARQSLKRGRKVTFTLRAIDAGGYATTIRLMVKAS